ncbi:uncharacterized protein BDZ83DRAFT_426705 [Colletotrichum acutatum]|uniref:Uncharacterized protein n=1 Tax=Glomerella acutata TaxID=27357 RepID=A0AAD9D1T1_GLOAC|nr:uncharacterized protein BDZ83DRAFT_426705 [Colletotrichum acutatum]KAK1730180.1 hypothetical protein BDZ83DRAFT_426705 [Colletotrichum acutatum]
MRVRTLLPIPVPTPKRCRNTEPRHCKIATPRLHGSPMGQSPGQTCNSMEKSRLFPRLRTATKSLFGRNGMGWDGTLREGYKEPTLVIKSTWHAAKEGTCAR